MNRHLILIAIIISWVLLGVQGVDMAVSITSPTNLTEITMGEKTAIRWDLANTEYTDTIIQEKLFDIFLIEAATGSTRLTIQKKVFAGTGEIIWKVPTSLYAGCRYQIKLSLHDDPDIFATKPHTGCLYINPAKATWMWAIGVTISIFGSIFSNIGTNLQKLSLTRQFTVELAKNKVPYFRQPLWIVGFALVLVGALGDLAALGFAPQSLVTPVGACTVVVNVFLARWVLHEKLSRQELGATAAVVAGVALLAAYTAKGASALSAAGVRALLARPAFAQYGAGMAAGAGVLYLVGRFCERRLRRFGPHDPRYRRWRRLHPLSPAGLSGLLGAQTVLAAKIFTALVNATLQGDNQLRSWPVYAFGAAMHVFLVAQIHWLAVALKSFDAVYVVPVFQCFFISGSILGGVAVFREIVATGPLGAGLCLLGVALVLAGVAVLSRRRALSRQTPLSRLRAAAWAVIFVHRLRQLHHEMITYRQRKHRRRTVSKVTKCLQHQTSSPSAAEMIPALNSGDIRPPVLEPQRSDESILGESNRALLGLEQQPRRMPYLRRKSRSFLDSLNRTDTALNRAFGRRRLSDLNLKELKGRESPALRPDFENTPRSMLRPGPLQSQSPAASSPGSCSGSASGRAPLIGGGAVRAPASAQPGVRRRRVSWGRTGSGPPLSVKNPQSNDKEMPGPQTADLQLGFSDLGQRPSPILAPLGSQPSSAGRYVSPRKVSDEAKEAHNLETGRGLRPVDSAFELASPSLSPGRLGLNMETWGPGPSSRKKGDMGGAEEEEEEEEDGEVMAAGAAFQAEVAAMRERLSDLKTALALGQLETGRRRGGGGGGGGGQEFKVGLFPLNQLATDALGAADAVGRAVQQRLRPGPGGPGPPVGPTTSPRGRLSEGAQLQRSRPRHRTMGRATGEELDKVGVPTKAVLQAERRRKAACRRRQTLDKHLENRLFSLVYGSKKVQPLPMVRGHDQVMAAEPSLGKSHLLGSLLMKSPRKNNKHPGQHLHPGILPQYDADQDKKANSSTGETASSKGHEINTTSDRKECGKETVPPALQSKLDEEVEVCADDGEKSYYHQFFHPSVRGIQEDSQMIKVRKGSGSADKVTQPRRHHSKQENKEEQLQYVTARTSIPMFPSPNKQSLPVFERGEGPSSFGQPIVAARRHLLPPLQNEESLAAGFPGNDVVSSESVNNDMIQEQNSKLTGEGDDDGPEDGISEEERGGRGSVFSGTDNRKGQCLTNGRHGHDVVKRSSSASNSPLLINRKPSKVTVKGSDSNEVVPPELRGNSMKNYRGKAARSDGIGGRHATTENTGRGEQQDEVAPNSQTAAPLLSRTLSRREENKSKGGESSSGNVNHIIFSRTTQLP